MNCLPTHAPTLINPYPAHILHSAPQGNATINPLWSSLLYYCPNASSPVCDVISCAVEKVNNVGCFACCAGFEVALISPSVITHGFFLVFFFAFSDHLRLFAQMPNNVSVKDEVTECLCHDQWSLYCLQFISIYMCKEKKNKNERFSGFSAHTTAHGILPWHSASEDHPPPPSLHLQGWFTCQVLEKMLLGRLVGASGLLCSQRGEMHGDTHAWEEEVMFYRHTGVSWGIPLSTAPPSVYFSKRVLAGCTFP